jgi:hypothetical protein
MSCLSERSVAKQADSLAATCCVCARAADSEGSLSLVVSCHNEHNS